MENKDICKFHSGLENKLDSIQSDLKDIKKILYGDGGNGFMQRLVRLEYDSKGLWNIFFRVVNVLEAIAIGYILYILNRN